MEIEESASLLNSLKAQLEIVDSIELPLTSGCCIYKVPSKLREVNEKAFSPSVVSIGPFHHGDKRLEPMQEIKFWHFNKFLKRSHDKSLQDYVKVLKDWEGKIRCYYSETIAMKSDEFVSMILTDACFIIEFFLQYISQLEESPLNKREWPTTEILLDLILLENQLPFFVLEHLFNLTFPTGFDDGLSFHEVAFHRLVKFFLSNICPFNEEKFEKFSLPTNHQMKHLCDLLRTFYLPCNLPPRKPDLGMKHSYTVSQLHEAGIKFEAADQDKRVIEVQCSKEVLKLPSITLSGFTEIILVNVVAFEQCHIPYEHYVTDYLILLDCLIDSGKDVEILVEKGIIHIYGDTDVMASMINKHRLNVVEISINSDYIPLYAELNKFYNNPFHKYKAVFVREYWSSPWKIASVIAAVVLLLLTFIQTICSVIPLFKN